MNLADSMLLLNEKKMLSRITKAMTVSILANIITKCAKTTQ